MSKKSRARFLPEDVQEDTEYEVCIQENKT